MSNGEAKYDEAAGFLNRHPGIFRLICFLAGILGGVILVSMIKAC